MTRDEAAEYINAHPSTFQGVSPETALARMRSSNDPEYYSPSLYTAPAAPAPAKPKPKPVAIVAPKATQALIAPASGLGLSKSGPLGVPRGVWFAGLAGGLGLAIAHRAKKRHL